MQTESYQWKNVEANLSLDITPYVSLDSCITMQIDLNQSEFTERESQDAPPGTTTRSFNSIIKVNNEEMVLLGGIERNLTGRTSKGLPFIARIPVLRWLFGRTTRTNNVQKLNVFIKPTIIL
jgi:type IV pilus assembly protein PilQ